MDKVLLVTGGSSEVGIQLIRDVYSDYKLIYIQYFHMNEELQRLVDEISNSVEVILVQCDFSDSCSVTNLIDSIKTNGVLPNQIVHLPAPKAYNKQFHKDVWDNFDAGWEVSVHSIVEILKAFIPNMSKQRYGRIVFMLTSNTINNPAKYQSSYVTVKYALLGLMRSLAVEYIDKGITVNGVSPDMMETKFLSELPHLIVEQNAANSPIGRNIRVDEVVPVIAHMLSDAGASMTGQNIGITGGL